MLDLYYAAWLVGSVVAIWLAVVVLSQERDLVVPESREKTLTGGDLYHTWKASKEDGR